MEHERNVVLCPIVTLLPITVSDIWLPRLDVADRTTVPSCRLVLLPTVILPSSPAADSEHWNAWQLFDVAVYDCMHLPLRTQPYHTEAF